jgi:hypothetical protein
VRSFGRGYGNPSLAALDSNDTKKERRSYPSVDVIEQRIRRAAKVRLALMIAVPPKEIAIFRTSIDAFCE